MKLREIAFSRSGDRGVTSNICVFPYDEKHWEFLRGWLTPEIVREKYGHLVRGEVVRYEFPKLRGLNFVLRDALGGGGLPIRTDKLGKCYQSLILDIELPADRSLD